jgi:predicted butyrate kinase (DUF1464 family)
MISLGIDAGTKSFKTCLMKEEKMELRSQSPEKAYEYLMAVRKKYPDCPIVLPSGFGIPLKEACSLTDRDIFEMTLKKEDTNIVGLGKFLKKVRHLRKAYCIPSVKLLPTVPLHRKINRIDMGTSDKLCSIAFILERLMQTETPSRIDFMNCEVGWGFASLIVVRKGKIVDGVGGSSLLGPLCRGAIDAELAYLHTFSKKEIYGGGFLPVEETFHCGSEMFREELEKKIYGLREYHGIDRLILTGRRKRAVKKIFPRARILLSENEGFEAATGAAIIASGLCGGAHKRIVDLLAIRKASGSVTDFICGIELGRKQTYL